MSRRIRARSGGYTLVELMMALALFTVAMLGIIVMQKLTTVSNAHAKNVAMAERIAQAWAGQLEMDASAWQGSFGTGFLNGNGVWQRPAYIAGRNFGAAFDALGNALGDTPSELARARYCTHVRMSWLYPTTMAVRGSAALRAEIRVFWLREGETPLTTGGKLCDVAQTAADVKNIGLAPERYYFLYQPLGIRQHFQI